MNKAQEVALLRKMAKGLELDVIIIWRKKWMAGKSLSELRFIGFNRPAAKTALEKMAQGEA